MAFMKSNRPDPNPRPEGEAGLVPRAQNPGYAPAHAALAEALARRSQTEERRKRAIAKARGDASGRPLVAIAKDLVLGGVIAGTSPAQEIDACDLEFGALSELIVQCSEAEQLALSEVSFEAANLFKPVVEEHHRTILHHLEAAAAAARAIHEIHAELMSAGYSLRHDVLPAPPMAMASVGFPENTNANVATYRRFLAERKII